MLEEQLKEIAEKDISVERNELGDGYSSIAIPVFKDNKMVYTMSAFSTTQLINESYDEVLGELRAIRDKIYELPDFH